MIDACCLIDLLASGQAEAILRATGHTWHLPTSVQAEVQYVRQHDPDNPGAYPERARRSHAAREVRGCSRRASPTTPRSRLSYVHYATLFRSDGEAMCLALAECRGWIVATDDRRAIEVAQQAGLTVVSCPELVKAWADATRPDSTSLVQVLTDIQTLAQFRPNPTMPESDWWSNLS